MGGPQGAVLLKPAKALLALAMCLFLGVFVSLRRHAGHMAELSALAAAGTSTGLSEVRNSAVTYARSMRGLPYDPLKGEQGDPFGKIGFVVCIDVPLRAYMHAGFDPAGMLRQAAQEHPSWFSIDKGNQPGNRFFYRRVRNYVGLFKNHPALETSGRPQPGDWAFFGPYHIALVSTVFPDGRYEVIEASGRKMHVGTNTGEKMEQTWGPPLFFGRWRARTI